MPASFFQNRPELAGVRGKRVHGPLHVASGGAPMDGRRPCARVPPGARLGRRIHDHSVGEPDQLRLSRRLAILRTLQGRSDADIIAEVVAVIEEGVHRGNPQAKVLVSDWGWRGHGDARDIIARLPKSVRLVSVSEWDLPIERGGTRTTVGEYSISSVGPGPRALQHWKAATRSRAEDGGRDPVQQHVRNRQRTLFARNGPRGRTYPQPGAGQAGWHVHRLDDGRVSFAQLPACPATESHACPRRSILC